MPAKPRPFDDSHAPPDCKPKSAILKDRIVGSLVMLVGLACAGGVILFSTGTSFSEDSHQDTAEIILAAILVLPAWIFLTLGAYLFFQAPKKDRQRLSLVKSYCAWLVTWKRSPKA